MEVEYIAGTAAFVEVIDVLGDDLHIPTLSWSEAMRAVSPVRLGIHILAAQAVEEVVDPLGVTLPGNIGIYLHNGFMVPKTVAAAEGGYAALDAHSGALGEIRQRFIGFF